MSNTPNDEAAKYQEKLEKKIKELEHEFERYLTTATLFYSIWNFFKVKHDFPVEIEPSLKLFLNNGNPKPKTIQPDIVFYRNHNKEGILLIIEYKYGIKGDPKYVLGDLKDVEKYLGLSETILLVPNSQFGLLLRDNIIDQLNPRLIIWGVEINPEKKEIKFIPHREMPSYRKFVQILEEQKYKIPYKIVTIRFPFIRQNPPPPYAAIRLWNILTSIAGTYQLYDESEPEFDYDEIYEELEDYFPPWLSLNEDTKQFKQKVFRRAIELLEYAKFLKIDWRNRKIKVNIHKGRNIKDLKEYLIRKAAEREIGPKPKLKPQKKEKETIPQKQVRLNGWIKIRQEGE